MIRGKGYTRSQRTRGKLQIQKQGDRQRQIDIERYTEIDRQRDREKQRNKIIKKHRRVERQKYIDRHIDINTEIDRQAHTSIVFCAIEFDRYLHHKSQDSK